MAGKNKILYYAGWNSFTHIGGAYNLARSMPDVEFHVVSAEKWPFRNLENVTFHKLIRPNCAMRIDEKFFLHTYPYEKDLGDLDKYRKHLFEYLKLLRNIQPNLVVVDITLEIAIWSKFLGYPVALFYETLDSDNLRHQLAWNNVDSILVRYPKHFVATIEPNLNSKMFFSGGVSKFDSMEIATNRERNFEVTGAVKDKRKIVTVLSSSHSYNNAQVRKYFETICEALNNESEKIQCFMLYPENDKLAERLKEQYKNINFVIGVFNKVQYYLAISDLVITGAGMGATMESAYFRVPMLIIPVPWIIKEQALKANGLESIGAAKVVNPAGMIPEDITSKMYEMLGNKDLLQNMKDNERKLIDKNGYKRLASHINRMLKSSKCQNKISVIRD